MDVCFLDYAIPLKPSLDWEISSSYDEVVSIWNTVYSTVEEHAQHLQDWLDNCMTIEISINTTKSVFLIPSGKLVGHITSKQGVATNLDNIASIIALPISTTVT